MDFSLRSYGSIPTPDGYRGSVSDTSEDASVLSEEGRLPTPRLETGGQRQRHHLDKTTPASGGCRGKNLSAFGWVELHIQQNIMIDTKLCI